MTERNEWMSAYQKAESDEHRLLQWCRAISAAKDSVPSTMWDGFFDAADAFRKSRAATEEARLERLKGKAK